MRENIKDLRTICQFPRLKCDTWHGRYIARPVSIYITILFLKLNISANVITAISLFTGVLAAALLLFGSRTALVVSVVILQLWYVIDHVDGEVARYKKESSLTGVYLDHLSHYIIHSLFFLCLGIGLSYKYSNILLLLLGIVSGFSIVLINVVVDVYDLMMSGSEKKSLTEKLPSKRKNFLSKVFSFIYKMTTFPVIMDLFFLVVIADIFLRMNILVIFLWFYAIILTCIWIVRLSYIIATRKLDK